jgi:hypothetical protein
MCGFGDELASQLAFLERLGRDAGLTCKAELKLAPQPGRAGSWQITVWDGQHFVHWGEVVSSWDAAFAAAQVAMIDLIRAQAEVIELNERTLGIPAPAPVLQLDAAE